MKYVYSLEYSQKPDYSKMKKMFEDELKKRGMKADSKGLDWLSGSVRMVCGILHSYALKFMLNFRLKRVKTLTV